MLTPAAVAKVKYLRSVVSPLLRANAFCTSDVAAPLLADGYLYASTNEYLSKYDAATGKLLWRVNPTPTGHLFSTTNRWLSLPDLSSSGPKAVGQQARPVGS